MVSFSPFFRPVDPGRENRAPKNIRNYLDGILVVFCGADRPVSQSLKKIESSGTSACLLVGRIQSTAGAAAKAVAILIRLKTETLKGLTDMRILHIGYLFSRCFWSWCAFIFLNFCSKTTRPGRRVNEEEKPSFLWCLVEKWFWEIYTKIAWF